ncbi:hypothetical protein ACQP3J_30755 [Escherichia coli]
MQGQIGICIEYMAAIVTVDVAVGLADVDVTGLQGQQWWFPEKQ